MSVLISRHRKLYNLISFFSWSPLFTFLKSYLFCISAYGQAEGFSVCANLQKGIEHIHCQMISHAEQCSFNTLEVPATILIYRQHFTKAHVYNFVISHFFL
jgi:hypothetical protein